jgi:FKBP-type peptidyl-prolyl cis-trans isomerase
MVPPAEAVRHESGLITLTVNAGTGEESPGSGDVVKLHYSAWTPDGEKFESSVERKFPVYAPFDALMPGWKEALVQMSRGGKTLLWTPEKLGFAGRAGRPSGTILFEVELLDFTNPTHPPDDVAAPPEDAEQSRSRLAWKVLREGDGGRTPGPRSHVTVHYTGWTKNGEMFDSSLMRGQPANFPLDGVIRGWTEGLQLMTVGEKRRFWIPDYLAYRGDRSKPQGMLVFDIELLAID